MPPKHQRPPPNGKHPATNGHTPATEPPAIHIETQMRRYPDATPDFGYDILGVTINGITVQVYRACLFTNNGRIMELPLEGGMAFLSEEAADAFQAHEQQTGEWRRKVAAQKSKIVLPGSPDFQPPKL